MSTPQSTGQRPPAAAWLIAGALAGLLGLAVARWATSLLTSRVDPVHAMAEQVVALTPGAAQRFLIHLPGVGTNDKPLLVGGITVVALAASAYAGLLRRTARWPSDLVFVVMGVIAALAAFAARGAGLREVVPVVLGVVTWLVAADLATRPLRAAHADRDPARPADQGWDRRGFLARVGFGAVAVVLLGAAGQTAASGRSQVRRIRRALRLPVTRGTVPAGADLGVDKASPWRTPNDEFYRIDTAIVLPETSADWSVRIHGMVERELTLTFEDLQSMQLTEDWITICCVSNEVGGDLIGNAWWSGVRLAPLLERAGVRPDADAVLQTSADGWTCGTPLSALTDDRNAMLAIAMNGEPLPVEHGFPVRTIVPGLYGYVSATKWVVDLEVTRFSDFEAYWTQRGWGEKGPIKTMSRIDVPRVGDDLPSGRSRIGGVAWAQGTGIERVEYQVDGGPWTRAGLGRVDGVDTWVQWAATVSLEPGRHTVRCRATDRSGYTQTGVNRGVLPDGATGWDTRDVVAL